MTKQYCKGAGKVKQCLSRREAGEIVNSERGKYRHRKKHVPLRFYWCEYCKAYHTTHKKEGK